MVWKVRADFPRRSIVTKIQLRRFSLCRFSQRHFQKCPNFGIAGRSLEDCCRFSSIASSILSCPDADFICGADSAVDGCRIKVTNCFGDRGTLKHHIGDNKFNTRTHLLSKHYNYSSINYQSSCDSSSTNFGCAITTRDINISVMTMSSSSSSDAKCPIARNALNLGSIYDLKSRNRIGINVGSDASYSNAQRTIMHLRHTYRGIRIINRTYLNARCFSSRSGSSANENDSTKILLRHFLFQIHPDYFLQFKTEQEVNSRHYGILQEICSDYNPYQGHRKDNVRTLAFYTKPTEKEPVPRRVKISVGSKQKIESSIIDVLETLGVNIPYIHTHSEGKTTRSSVLATKSSAVEMAKFLDTLVDRKDLMLWRFQRSEALVKLLDDVTTTLGVDRIDIRYSWSAQNNSILLSSLMRIIEPRFEELRLPWTGLTLVLCFDDCSQIPVDGIEGHVMINPSHVPMQWLNIFQQAGHPSVLSEAKTGQAETHLLEKMFEIAASEQLKLSIKKQIEKMLKDENDDEKPVFSLSGLSVKIRRGHTCSKRWYLYFLNNMKSSINSIIEMKKILNTCSTEQENCNNNNIKDLTASFTDENTIQKNNIIINEEKVKKNYYLPAIKTENIFLFEKTIDKKVKNYMNKFFFLQYLPLEIEIVVEEGHGTKLLQSGELRADCRCSALDIDRLIKNKCVESLKFSAENKILKNNVEELRDAVMEKFGFLSIEAGVGVDLSMMESCLSRLKEYQDKTQNKKNEVINKNIGKFRSLSGMRVVVGKYLGLGDDGKCILPWDWSI